MQFFFAPVITLKFYVIPFTKIRVARKTSVSTTHCRLNEFDAANRTFWVWYKITRTINETRPRLIIKYLAICIIYLNRAVSLANQSKSIGSIEHSNIRTADS